MAYYPLVSDRLDAGAALIEALGRLGFPVPLAFWGWDDEEGRWSLYLVSPRVDEDGPNASYRVVGDAIKSIGGVGIDPLDVHLLETSSPIVPEVIRFQSGHGMMTSFGAREVGGVRFDRAEVYPSTRGATSAPDQP